MPLTIPPGVYRDGTGYQAKGRWYDANLVRFFEQTIRPVGGWRRAQDASNVDLAALTGLPRAAIAWRSAAGDSWLGIGTAAKLDVLVGGTIFDETPASFATALVWTGSLVTSGIAAAGASSVTLTATTLTGSVAVNDVFLVGGNYYRATGAATAAANAVTVAITPVVVAGGISAGTAVFPCGRPDSVFSGTSGGYGGGLYGVGAYGTGSLSATLLEAATWQLDLFGQFLVAVSTADSKLYVWQAATGTKAAVASGSPLCKAAVVTPERFLVALGAAGDVRYIQWASQETFDTWTATALNTAGDFTLTTTGRIMCGRRTKNETLIFTDTDLHKMTYIGGAFVYRFDQAGDQCGITAPNAVAMVDSTAFWMGRNSFFMYNGVVQQLPCDVADYVFSDINDTQRAKVWAVANPEFSEVWFFYPSSASSEIDRYVAYNYREQHWTIGQLSRTAGAPSGAVANPILLDATGLVWEHEVGSARTGTAYIESGPVELGDGDSVMKIQRIVPDEKTLGDVQAYLYTSLYPTDTATANGPYTLTAPTSVRLTARQARIRFSEVRATDWRVGAMRLGLRTGGRR